MASYEVSSSSLGNRVRADTERFVQQTDVTDLILRAEQLIKRHKGDLLVRFDCSRYNAELAATKAEHVAYKKTYENNLELERLNAIGKSLPLFEWKFGDLCQDLARQRRLISGFDQATDIT